jgi:hypothetical protein
MFSCAQQVTQVVPTGSQPTIPNTKAAAKPAERVVARVSFKAPALPKHYDTEFSIYHSYRHEPWFLVKRVCLESDAELNTDVYWNNPQNHPEIKFTAEIISDVPLRCTVFRGALRTLAFHQIVFNPSAHFHVKYDFDQAGQKYVLCAHGGGSKEVCDKG